MYCLAPMFCNAEVAMCIVWLPFICEAEGAVCIVWLPVFGNAEEGSINICTLLSPEDSFFFIWLPVLVMLKKGV